MGGPGDKMWITRTFPIFAYFSAKTNPKTETSVLGREKTETEFKFKIAQPPKTSRNVPIPDSVFIIRHYSEIFAIRQYSTFG